jgi:hypothetical protein
MTSALAEPDDEDESEDEDEDDEPVQSDYEQHVREVVRLAEGSPTSPCCRYAECRT